MKRFFFSILCVSVFFLGLGALVEKTGAKFKSDERALDLVSKARQALGGDSALNAVQSLRIVGQTTHTVKIDGTEKTHQGDTEIALQMPNKFMKMIKMGSGDGRADGQAKIERKVDVVVLDKAGDGEKIAIDNQGPADTHGVRRIIIKKPDGTTEELTGAEADKVIIRDLHSDKLVEGGENKQVFVRKAGGGDHSAMRQNEMLRTTLALLLTAPQGTDVSYTFGGESSVDGTPCNIVVAESGSSSFKIYLNSSSNLPVMMTYTGHQMPRMFKFTEKAPEAGGTEKTMTFRSMDGPPHATAEFSVKFTDYRSVNGVQMPYRWTRSIAGVVDETFDVTSYEVNPANIAEKFQHDKMIMRTAKPE
jgi:hypothetical protein